MPKRSWGERQRRAGPAPPPGLGPSGPPPPAAFIRAYESQLLPAAQSRTERLLPWAGDESVLADRYNIIHLLSDLPSPPPSPARKRASSVDSSSSLSSSWSVPSDAEGQFELSGDEEVSEHKRAQRQKWVDGLRAARLAEREKEDEAEAERIVQEDERRREETPPPDITTLMTHTARSLAASPNAASLISRIMTRHAADARFAFLRTGPQARWAGAWEKAQLDAGYNPNPRPAPKAGGKSQVTGGLGGLGGYGSDDSSSSSCSPPPEPDEPPPPPPPEDAPPPPPGPPPPTPLQV